MADTGYDHQNAIWAKIGNIACVDSDEWIKLWEQKYIPGYDALGVSGLFLDQGPTQYLICPKDGHRHGTDTVLRLSAHARGVNYLINAFKENFKNRKPFFWTEVGSDIQTRHADIWTTSDGYDYALGGIMKNEIGRYSFPYRLCVGGHPKTASGVNELLANGFILGGWSQWPEDFEELLYAWRQYLRIRQSLRKDKAPGFPYGFKDTVGLDIQNENLVARAYRDDQGIPVVYYGADTVETGVTVDMSSLGFKDKGKQSFAISLLKNEAGYKMILP
jgi:hypothetical protein